MNTLYYESSISHHGIKGQKWGVRRFQNPDGSPRYNKASREDLRREKDLQRGKKLHDKGLSKGDIIRANSLTKDSVRLGASTVRSIMVGTGISFTPIGGIALATISAGQLAYNLIQSKHEKKQLSSYDLYDESLKK